MSIHVLAARGASAHRDPRKAGSLAAIEALSRLQPGWAGTLLLFASGPHGAWARSVAAGAQEVAPDATIALVGTPRISSADDPEVCVGGVSAIALPMKSKAVIARGDYSASSLGALGRAVGGERAGATLLFGRSRPGARVALESFAAESNATRLAGALGVGAGLAAAVPGGEVEEGALLALRIDDGAAISKAATSSVRPLVEFERVTSIRRGYVERVGERRALDWLRESGGGAPEGSLLLALLQGRDHEGAYLVRGIAGIEPSRGAIHIGDDVVVGERISVGVSTGRVTATSVEAACRRAAQGLHGGAPHAALLVDPVGRSSRAALAETRDFTRRFGDIPWIGIRAAAQIVGGAPKPRIAQHMAALWVVYSAS